MGRLLSRIANRDQVHMMADEEAVVCILVVIDADGHDGQIGVVMVKLDQRGHLLDAGGAPGCPKAEHNNTAPVAGQMDGGCAVGDGEIRGCLVRLSRMSAAIAAGSESQQQKQTERKEA